MTMGTNTTWKKLVRTLMMVGVGGWAAMAGCIPIKGSEFRDAALPAIESGVNAIIDGFVTGIFAAIEPEAETGVRN